MELMPTEIYARMPLREAEFCFFSDLKKDEAVKRTGAEDRIKRLMNKMRLYASQMNEALFNYKGELSNKVGEVTAQLESIRREMGEDMEREGRICANEAMKLIGKLIPVVNSLDRNNSDYCMPVEINFADAARIAHAVGTYVDKRGLLKRKFSKADNPLERVVGEYEKRLDEIWNNPDADIARFDEGLALEIERARGEKKEVMEEMRAWAEEHLKREFGLARLATEYKRVHRINANLRAERTAIKIVSVVKPEAIDLITGKDPLEREEVEQISDYFDSQNQINGLFFMAAYLTYLRRTGVPNEEAIGIVERTHEIYEKEWDINGFVGVDRLEL